MVSHYSRKLQRDIMEWDVATVSTALRLWNRWSGVLAGAKVLEIGARNGGLSLYFALKGSSVICSDLRGPSASAVGLHRRHGVSERITCCAIDATAIDYPDGEFDVVCFKSVLGGLGAIGGYATQERAVHEMHRVLRHGGNLLFAENLRGCFFHRYLRRKFVTWAKEWRYVELSEIPSLFQDFQDTAWASRGFLATLGRTEFQRTILHTLDVIVQPLVPNKSRYWVFGCATK
ncbi:MAG: class I SAM-dependent methyltransferase [Phycisphaerae bacterium]